MLIYHCTIKKPINNNYTKNKTSALRFVLTALIVAFVDCVYGAYKEHIEKKPNHMRSKSNGLCYTVCNNKGATHEA